MVNSLPPSAQKLQLLKKEQTMSKKITISGNEYDLPEGIVPLGDDDLYKVSWELLECPPELEQEDKFQFFNPRHLGKYEENDEVKLIGQGFGKDEMGELLKEVQNNGLDYNLLCHWAIADGEVKVLIHDGERRWRCIDFLRLKKENVWDIGSQQFLPATDVYSSVTCRIKTLTDEEALTRACAVSNTSIKWGDAAYARLVKVLYKMGKTDDQVCKVLNKGKQWIAETYQLNELDDYSFSFLLEGKINRKCALDLAKISDLEVRKSWLNAAWEDAIKTHKEIQDKTEEAIDKSVVEEEIAESELAEAQLNNEPEEVITELKEKIEEAAKKTKKRKEAKAASAKPVIKSKNLSAASGALGVLKAPKIKKSVKTVQDMIQRNDFSLADIKVLRAVELTYQSVLEGESDVVEVLKKIIV